MSELWMNIQAYFTSRLDEYLICLWQHISISILALLAAALIGIPCGYLCIRYVKCKKWLVGIFQILRYYPHLAILILLIPIMEQG